MNNTYCVIMAGGQGNRLWPLSTPALPKQFIDLMGVGQSMLQIAYNRYKPFFKPENIIVVANQEHVQVVCEQLPDLPRQNILAEPFRRNTAPCVAYANAYIKQKNPNAIVFVTPADHFLVHKSGRFENSVTKAIAFVKARPDAIVTLGVKANRPDTSFGYIQKGGQIEGYPMLYKVKAFTEKPNYEMAQLFYNCGEFCWNAGVFVWTVSTAEESLKHYLPNVQKQFDILDNMPATSWSASTVSAAYEECDNISIDIGILEKASNVYVQQTDAVWADLGSWRSLSEAASKDEANNSVITGDVALERSRNCIVKLPKNKKCVIDGLDGYMVIDRGDVLLICPCDRQDATWSYAGEFAK